MSGGFFKVEDDTRRNFFKQHLQQISIKVFFSDISQIRTKQQSILCSSERGDTKKWLVSLQQEQMSYMRVTNMHTRETAVSSRLVN